MDEIDIITGEIIDAAVKLHKRIGPGALESMYEAVLARELARRGLVIEQQKTIDVVVDDVRYDRGIRVDLLVNGIVVVEIKSIERLAPVHTKQVITYLRLLNLPVGLLLNLKKFATTADLRAVRVSQQFHCKKSRYVSGG